MMIECPRCGFAQPKDQYCASCGVNIDHLLAKPKPLLVRLLANPNFHLSLIGVLIAVVVAWIFYTQSATVSREVGRMLDLPVSSRNAGEPVDPESENLAAAQAVAEESLSDIAEEEEGPESAGGLPGASAALGTGDTRSPEDPSLAPASAGASAGGALSDPKNIELMHWEVPRESLAGLLVNAQRLSDSNGGRAYYWPQGSKIAETLQTTGQPLGTVKSVALQANAQLSNMTAATAPEMFQFSIAAQVSKYENKEASVRWSVNFYLPQAEPPGESGPAMRQVMEGQIAGSQVLAPQGLIMLIVEPPNRSAREDQITRAGEGPWSVFGSPEFRSGLTDWVMIIQLK
jgi:hypothetical protein